MPASPSARCSSLVTAMARLPSSSVPGRASRGELSVKVGQREPHQQIPQRGWIKYTRVEQHDLRHWSIAHTQFLAQCLELIERGMPLGYQVPLVGEHILELDAAVGPYTAALQHSIVDELQNVTL
jgi:hypothetical protein